MQKVVSFGLIVALGAFIVGCEWQSSSDGDSWNDAYSWADFGGVYRPIEGRAYLIDSFEAGSTPIATAGNGSQSIGTGNGIQANFNSTLGNSPVVNETVTVTAGGQTLTDAGGNGTLSGDGTGTINYSTGGIVASFTLAPAVGVNVLTTYKYIVDGAAANPSPGSTPAVYTMNVNQTGQRLSFVDSNGMNYSGDITSVSGIGEDGTSSGAVVANFSVAGADGSKITGVFQGDFTAAELGEDGSASGTLNRSMNGTYVSASGGTGDVLGQAAAINVTQVATTSEDPDDAVAE